MSEPLVPEILESLTIADDGAVDWGNNTDRLIEEFGRKHRAPNLATVIRDNAPSDCNLDRLGFFIGILLKGFPGIDASQLGRQLRDWVHSPVEVEFRCAISELYMLYHCDPAVESITATFGDAMEARWPAYRGRVHKIKEIWLANVVRVRQEDHRRRHEQ